MTHTSDTDTLSMVTSRAILDHRNRLTVLLTALHRQLQSTAPETRKVHRTLADAEFALEQISRLAGYAPVPVVVTVTPDDELHDGLRKMNDQLQRLRSQLDRWGLRYFTGASADLRLTLNDGLRFTLSGNVLNTRFINAMGFGVVTEINQLRHLPATEDTISKVTRYLKQFFPSCQILDFRTRLCQLQHGEHVLIITQIECSIKDLLEITRVLQQDHNEPDSIQ